MKTKKQQYDIHLNLASTGIIKAANAVCIESDGRLKQFGFRYTPEYLELNTAISLDPLQLPLTHKELQLDCSGGIPGILDDYLPDNWGKRVLAYIAFYLDKKKVSYQSCIDTLAHLSNSRIGALQWTPENCPPEYKLGCDFQQLHKAENAAQEVEANRIENAEFDELSLLYLANAGTGIGGARPKALFHKNQHPYLAKFNRLQHDEYNNARVELACLRMAKEAGIYVYDGLIECGINGREVLLLERFDVDNNRKRRHIITMNTLLKSVTNQSDNNIIFRYDDVADIIRKYSMTVEHDLEQLLRIMLFNRGINNIDDHERNFSLINHGDGYRLSPAYDMVPSLTLGAYHVAGFQHSPSPPKASEIRKFGKVFGLPKTRVKRIAEEVIAALQKWEKHANSTELSQKDMERVSSIIRI